MGQMRDQAIHGALDYEELERLGLSPEGICDFSVNSNPYGPSPRVQQALALVPVDRYPDRVCLGLRRVIQAYELGRVDLSLDAILCGNGTAELIWAVARAFLRPEAKAAILGPTFADYHVASVAAGAAVVESRASAAEQFQLDMGAVTTWIEQERPSLLWLCNPNNPTGTWLDSHALSTLKDVCQKMSTVLVIDEAYRRFLMPQESFSAVELVSPASDVPFLVLRSLTKDFALAGVRLGYAVASPKVLEHVLPHLPSWSVNGFAQAAGIAAITDRQHLATTLHELATQRDAFFSALAAYGLRIVPSRTHFCLIDVGDARSIRQQLLLKNLLVRDCTSFGLPSAIRVATRQRSEWQHLVHVLMEVL